MQKLALQFRKNESGSLIPLGAFLLMAILFFSALTVDVGYAYYLRTKLQGAADSAAVAAAADLRRKINANDFEPIDEDAARLKALDFVKRNMPTEQWKRVTTKVDVKFGKWDSVKSEFVTDTDNLKRRQGHNQAHLKA